MKQALRQIRKLVGSQWLYRDAHYLVADVRIDPAKAARHVPRPLHLARPTARIFTAWFPDTSFGSSYREAGIFLPVRHGRQQAIHCPWIVVDDDVALIAGRELLGYPKKLASIDWRHDGDQLQSRAQRRGTTLVSMNATLGEPLVGEALAAPGPMLGRAHRNIRASLGLAIPWIVSFAPAEHIISLRPASIELTLGSSERDPLDTFGIGEVLCGHLYRVNLRAGSLPRPIAIASPVDHVRNLLLRLH